MFRSIRNRSPKGFTMVEAMTTSVITLLIVLASWQIYIMGSKRWGETSAMISIQRTARIALSAIVDGNWDPTSGQDVLSPDTFRRRNGISWTTLVKADLDANALFATPVISNSGHTISYKLEGDAAATNPRSFYLQTVGTEKALYYRDSGGTVHKVPGTEVNTNNEDIQITFEDPATTGFNFVYRVTVRVDRQVRGTRVVPYNIFVEYSDYVFIRNVA